MDSRDQINLGLSERFWTIRFKQVIYKQQMFPHNFSKPKMFKNPPPDRISQRFVYNSESFWAVQFTGSPKIFWEGQNLKFCKLVLPIFIKFRRSQKISRDPVNCTAQNDSELYRKCFEIRSGGRCLIIAGSKNYRKNIFAYKWHFYNELFKTAPTTLGWCGL